MAGNLGDMMRLLKQAKDVKKRLAEVQQNLSRITVTASAGGGLVTVVANGQQEILAVKIDPAAVNAAEVELLEELVLAAVNTARKKAENLAREELGALARQMGLPEGLSFPGAPF